MEILDFTRREDSRITFGVRLSRQEWLPFLTRASLELQKKAPIPGFRAGKAPVPTAEKIYGRQLYLAAANEAGADCVGKACAERGLEPVSVPSFTVVGADRNGFECIVSFYNYPEIKDLAYRGLRPEKPHIAASEADVDQEVERYMLNHLNVHEVPRPAAMGDIVEVSFTGTSGGKPFPYDHSAKSRFLMGSGQLFAGLDQTLCGRRAGDELALALTMPKDFHRQEIAGLTLDLQVRLLGVWARDRYELDDDFVREHVRDAGTVEEFRGNMRKAVQQRLDGKCARIYTRNLEKALADAVDVPLPEAMVSTALERYMSHLGAIAASQSKSVEALLAEEGKTPESYRQSAMELARRQVRLSVALDCVIREENLSVTREELDRYYALTAEQLNVPREEAKQMLGGDGPAAESLLTKKAMRLVREAARPVEVELDGLPEEPMEEIPN